MSEHERKLIPVGTAARETGVPAQLIREAIVGGELEAFEFHNGVRVRRATVAAWLESRRTRPGPDGWAVSGPGVSRAESR